MSKPWFLYIAKARTGRFYTGITTDPDRRIQEHNRGEGAMMATEQGPFNLVYISPAIPNKSFARKRERLDRLSILNSNDKVLKEMILGEFFGSPLLVVCEWLRR